MAELDRGSKKGECYSYAYDANGNIIRIITVEGTSKKTNRYVYDDRGQLIREDNKDTNKTYTYTYDDAGNITGKKTFAYTSASTTPGSPTDTVYYGYADAWGDLMTSYDGVNITYDEIGNPLSYYNGASYTFTWEKGRRLSSATKGTSVTTFEYNEDGIRTSKTVNGVKHTYYLEGSRILSEMWEDNLCIYLYDGSGTPIGMRYRKNSYEADRFDTFWYTKNLQGDIVGVFNEEGVLVRSYVYDAWGVVRATIHNNTGTNSNSRFNPFFYRGYYYDAQLGLYYLNSRYYDPQTCRFINADGQLNGGLLGYNLFAYCGNNPVNYYDPSGKNAAAVLTWWASTAWGLTIVDGLLPIGDIIYVGGCVLIATVAIIQIAVWVDNIIDAVYNDTDLDNEPNEGAANLPNQGIVSEIPGAPPVDAGKQGKHVPGHNNNNPNKSQWKPGENGVRQTQEAWKNGTDVPGRDGKVRIGKSSDGRTIRVHIDGSGNIHGYPIFP